MPSHSIDNRLGSVIMPANTPTTHAAYSPQPREFDHARRSNVFVFRGRRGDLIKVLWFDGDGLCNPSTENPQYRL
jgi:IS66 Orf2 like protein